MRILALASLLALLATNPCPNSTPPTTGRASLGRRESLSCENHRTHLAHAQDTYTSNGTDGEDYKLHLLVDPEDADIDIIAVHGLDGHWKDSWTADNGVFWLQDLLPTDFPRARIFSFGHDSRTRGAPKPLTLDISDHGKDLVTSLANERYLSNTEERPLIFIGHSLGGLVIKSALLHSDMARVGHLEMQKSIQLSTSAVLFLATPHQGGEGVHLAQIMTRVLSVVSYTNPKLLDQVQQHSEWLQDLQSRYNSISGDFDSVFFYETYEMAIDVAGVNVRRLLVVPKFSAVIPGAVNAEDVRMSADHSSIAKYPGSTDPNYERVSTRLRVLASKAAPRVRQNWMRWTAIKDIEANPPPTSQLREQQVSNKPLEFRLGLAFDRVWNRQQFVGRETTLRHLDRKLHKTSSGSDFRLVVLYGIGGVGKTQIALQYAHLSKLKYSTIFWLDGSSKESALLSIMGCLERITNHYNSFGHGENPRNRKIKESLEKARQMRSAPSVQKTEMGNSPQSGAERFRLLTEAFISWLSVGNNEQWLIILDNVDDLESYDFRELLPNTDHGAVIITSRRSDLAVKWDAIEVTDMDSEEAIELLAGGAKLALQRETSEWDAAQRLVEMLSYFPLAIVQAASFIAARKQPQNPVANPIAEYTELFLNHSKTMLNHKNAKAAWDYRDDTTLTTWEISYLAVHEQMPRATQILHICAFLNRDSIYEELFILGLPQDQSEGAQVQQAFNLLKSYSFIRWSSSNSGFSMHPLVHMWAKIRLDRVIQEAVARETLEMLYRCAQHYGTSHRLEQLRDTSQRLDPLHFMELFSFYEKKSPCNLKDRIDFYADEHQPEFDAVLEGAYYFVRGTFDEAVSYIYRKYFTDGVSPLRDWELMAILDNLMNWRTSSHIRILAWVVCQASATHGSKHPKVLYHMGNYAHSLHMTGDIRRSRAWYEWLLVARRRVLGDSHPATAGAMLGIARLSHDCGVAIDSALGGFERRLYVLGYEDSLTVNAGNILDEIADACRDYLEDSKHDTLDKWKMRYIRDHNISVMDPRWPLREDSDEGRIANVRLARAYLEAGHVEEGTGILVNVLGALGNAWVNLWDWGYLEIPSYSLEVYAGQFAIDVVNRYSGLLASDSNRALPDLTAALERLWYANRPYALTPDQEGSYNARACVAFPVSFSLALLSWAGENSEMAERWLDEIPGVFADWFARGSCPSVGNSYIGEGYTKFPRRYFTHIVSEAFRPNHPWARDHSWVTTASFSHLILSRMMYLEPALGITLSLFGWDWAVCPSYLGASLRVLDVVYGGQIKTSSRCRLPLWKLAAERKLFMEQEESESCFSDVRRFSMCRAG
ncbi:hypothetical protein QBC47DRAFT_47883 [Echria macrotheca]|uniref:GPI inositol-deacylase n=1 Tax=Echria macrotheca TaxID=438768 RepID=A0AAJ0BB29_9PEZI|nr:hypothetical protein QBC47DRAFT_47883 [Echria macrotheca]